MSLTVTVIKSDEQFHALRAPVIGASEAAALVGQHEFLTYWGLWARKSKKLPPVADNGAMERGRRLEPVAVAMLRDRYPAWNVDDTRVHYADHEYCIGATPDAIAHDPERGLGTIQIKSVAPSIFRQKWRGDSDETKVPIWIAIQALMEAHLVGAKWAAVAALVVDHEIELHLIEIPLHPGLVDTIKTEALTFWRAVLAGREPDPDYRRDSELIRAMLAKDDGSEVDLSTDNELPELLDRREAALTTAREAKDEADAINARLLHMLGNASFGRFGGGYISAKTVNRSAYQVKATSYRVLRVVREAQPGQRA